MPVKVTAFQALQPLFTETDEKLQELRQELFVVKSKNLVALTKHPVFPERCDYFPGGFFRSTGDVKTQATWSAELYSTFKTTLAEKLAGRSIETIFEEPAPGPFFELLYFTEHGNAYFIGPKTSEKLARDFADNQGQAEGLGGDFYNIYRALQQSFEMASRSGAVRFNAAP